MIDFTITDDPETPFQDPAAGTRIESALRLLAQAQAYAADVGANPWDFAVELIGLEREGLTVTDLRWLIAKGYLHHGTDHSRPCSLSRQIEVSHTLRFAAQSCFIISGAGLALLSPNGRPKAVEYLFAESSPRPQWDNDRQELRLGDVLIKRFRLPAPNQRLVLMAFEEENWPFRIDDPLPHHPDIDAKRRLHHTLIALNRNHKCQAIRFLGDGSGEGVCWELVPTHNG